MYCTISFIDEDHTIQIQASKNDKMEVIFQKYNCKSGNYNGIFLYNGEKVDKNLTVGQISKNNDDIKINVMNIIGAGGDISFDENKNKIIFNINYNDKTTKIECKPEEKMGDIYKKFSDKNSIDVNSIYLCYNERVIIQKVRIQDFLNYDDKKRNEIKIYAALKDDEMNFKKSKEVICPICGDPAQIKLKNSKISIHECKYNHNIDDLNINEFETSQLINESKIICGKCKNINKRDTYKNEFFICNTCNLNLCPLCRSCHDKTHEIIYYENKNFKCGLHNEVYSLYCKTCKKNICTLCEQDHEDHDIIRLGKLIIKKDDLENKLKEFKLSLDKFREDIKRIINIFQKVLDHCENLYKINKEIIHNFDMKNRNYHVLNNLKEFYNDDISKKLENINNLENYGQKITQICKMYNIIDNNKLNFEFISRETEKIINEKGDKLMTVIFISDDQKVHYSLICKSTDKFKDVEQRLYKIYPEFSKTNNYFLANGNTINKSKNLEENKIKNSNIITLYIDTE